MSTNPLKLAERGAIISIVTYTFIAGLKIFIGRFTSSEALSADGWNNFTDILSNIFVLIGLKLSSRPKDKGHPYGHWKIETIASLLTSILMIVVGLNVIGPAIENLFHHKNETPDIYAFIIGLFSALIMYFVYRYNKKLAQKTKSNSLLAVAKDNLSDAYTSIGTSIAIIASVFHMPWLDTTAALIIGLIILKTALEIFYQSAFSLSDGFDNCLLNQYKSFILKIDGVEGVRSLRGREYGSHIFLDVVVYMNPQWTVEHSHQVTEIIEEKLAHQFNIYDVEVHVEPTPKKAPH